jgi:hypothetical protein
VLEQAYKSRGEDFPAAESARAKRPIIEFVAGLRLFNHGVTAKQAVDYIDTNTTDIFSNIEGSPGYNIDGEFLFEGARILVVADTDSLANNRIYTVGFITHNNRRQIHLTSADDSDSLRDESVLVRRGTVNQGKMFHYTGTEWTASQAKTSVNQAPRFDVFDSNEVSFSDTATYADTQFQGSTIISYKTGAGNIDSELGFRISYLNIDNIGDIQFDFNWDADTFDYTINKAPANKKIATGFYKIANTYANGWSELSNAYLQPIIDSQVVDIATNTSRIRKNNFQNNCNSWI